VTFRHAGSSLWHAITHDEEPMAGIEELFRSHWRLVAGYLARRTGDPGLAEELAQETFARAAGAMLGWRGESPTAWLLAIARNVLLDHTRKGRRLVPLSEPVYRARASLRALYDNEVTP
jgi:RNA polymerase sigma factor (sigma-70 family)